ncbi:MAG: MFS transporter [Trebonia sp.]
MPGHPDGVAADSDRGSPVSAWSPFRHRMFAAMQSAQFVSNVGSWMQTVAAQWLMLTLTGSAAYVALVQTAAGLPVVLFAIVAGTVGDLVDRRRFLLATQTFMLVAATALGALAIAGLVTPWVLLALVFAVGTGQALTSPTWQTLQPELVSPAERVQASGARGAHDLALDPRRRCAAARARRRGDPGRRPVHRRQPRAAGDLGPRRTVHRVRQRDLGATAADRPVDAAPGRGRLRAAAGHCRDRCRGRRRPAAPGYAPGCRRTPS